MHNKGHMINMLWYIQTVSGGISFTILVAHTNNLVMFTWTVADWVSLRPCI